MQVWRFVIDTNLLTLYRGSATNWILKLSIQPVLTYMPMFPFFPFAVPFISSISHPSAFNFFLFSLSTFLSLLHFVQTGSGAHPAYPMGTGGFFPRG
jgi:hypothetical protein